MSRTVDLPYGRGSLSVEVPDDSVIVESPVAVAVEDELAAVRSALLAPVRGPRLRDLVTRESTVAIAVCDGTRPQPRRPVVRAILEEIADRVDLANVVVLVATGTHRGNTRDELDAMFGSDLLGMVRVENHDAFDDDGLVALGTAGASVPVVLNRRWMEADVRVTTGFVEPHFFAGYSGGPKLVAPGLAGIETTLTLHDARRIGSPDATWGKLVGNPVHDDVRAIAAATGVHFSCDVVLNPRHEIVAAFAGELFAMHEAAVACAAAVATVPVAHPFDVVVTSNAGYPLDQNLYQAVKGMSAAVRVVRPGGLVVSVAECSDGFPAHGNFRELLARATSPAALLEELDRAGVTVPDQWQAQILARVLGCARVAVHADGLSDAELREVGLTGAVDVAATIADELERVGPTSRACVLPRGPEAIPVLAS